MLKNFVLAAILGATSVTYAASNDDYNRSASIFMVTKFKEKNCVVLVQDKKSGQWAIPGGDAKKAVTEIRQPKLNYEKKQMVHFQFLHVN